MGHLKIHCDGCGSDWVVYHRDNWKDWKARTCPVCGKSIDPGTSVSYIPDVVFPDRSGETDQLREEISDLKEGLEDLRSVVTRLLDSLFQV